MAFVGLGVPRLYTNAAAFTLFLEVYDASLLPYTYIATAIVVPLVGLLYLRLESRLTLAQVFVWCLLLDMAVLGGARLTLLHDGPQWIVWLLAVWVEAEWAISSLVFWGLAERAFNIRESKRWFGVAVAGEPLGTIVGGLVLPYFLVAITVPDLLWVSVVSVALGMILAVYLCRHADHDPHEPAPAESIRRSDSRLWPVRQYLFFIFALSVISVMVHFVVDNAFYERVEAHYFDEGAVAAFIGRFFTVVGVVTLFSNLVLTRLVLNRYGIRMALVLLPAMLLVVGSGVLIAGWYLHSPAAVLWFVCAAKLIDEAIRWGIFWPSFMVLYQPLSPRQRTRAQAINEGFIEQIAAVVGGVLLIALGQVVEFSAVEMFALALVLVVPWLVVTIAARQKYLQMLKQALPTRRLAVSRFSADSDESLSVIRAGLSSSRATDRIFCLQLLTDSGDVQDTDYQTMLLDPDSVVRRETARQIEHRDAGVSSQFLKVSCRGEHDPSAKAAMLRALARLEPEDSVVLLASCLKDRQCVLRFAAMVALLRYCGGTGVQLAGKSVRALASAESPADRTMAARVLGESRVDEFNVTLSELIGDEDEGVRNAALRAAASIGSVQLLEAVMDALSHSRSSIAAVSALAAMGETVIPSLIDMLVSQSVSTQSKLHGVRALARLGGAQAIAALEQLWRAKIPAIELEVVTALRSIDYRPGAATAVWIREQVQQYLGQGTNLLDLVDALRGHDATGDLQRALRSEIDQLRGLVYSACCVLHERAGVLPAWSIVSGGGSERIAYAVELLENALPRRDRLTVSEFLESATKPAVGLLARRSVTETGEIDARIERLIAGGDREYSQWVRACALRCARLRGWDRERGGCMLDGLHSASALIRETTVWALAAIAPDRLSPHTDRLLIDELDSIRTLVREQIQPPAETLQDRT